MPKSGFIAIIGRPNAGKSTLLNFVLGTEISIVTPKAQTTREQVSGILTDEKHGQIVFIDTPGIHRAREGGLNEFMVNQAKEALEAPHLIWYLIDPDSSIEHEKVVINLLDKNSAPVIVLLNKTDQLAKAKTRAEVLTQHVSRLESDVRQALQDKGIPVFKFLQISALKGDGVQGLLEDSWKLLPEGPFYYPDPEQVSDRPVRFFVAEKIRERIFYCLGDELPYSCAVEITRYDEKVKPTRIEATIYVERESQKGMVIGNGGKKIKEIGQTARMEIEKFVGTQVFLGLKVAVSKNWTEHAEQIKQLGYLP